jgi:hypothetical protein
MTRFAVVLVGLLLPTAAHADRLQSTTDQPLVEVSHTVDIRLDAGVATYVVQRQFKNAGKLADQAVLTIDLPAGAAATGLRIRAKSKWYDAELLDSEQAAERYRELTGIGQWDPKDPALLFWVSQQQLILQVFPIMPGTTSTVEYTLTVPTRYVGGEYWLTYPRIDATTGTTTGWNERKLAMPAISVRSGSGLVTIDGKQATSGRRIALAPAAHGDDQYATGVAIDVPATPRTNRVFATAKLDVDLHTVSNAELRLSLVSPNGEHLPIFDGDSGEALKRSYEVSLYPETKGAGKWRLIASDGQPATLVRAALSFGDSVHAARGVPMLLPDGSFDGGRDLARISIAPPVIATWTGRLGRVIASDAHTFSRLDLDVAPQVSSLPKRAQVAFVIDASYSAGPKLLAAQLAIVRAYASHVPDAEIEVIAVRRTAKRVFGRLVPASQIGAALEDAMSRGALVLGNGSALDDGARLAVATLAGRPGPQRVVITTDDLFRTSLTERVIEQALRPLDPKAIVHVVVPRIADHEQPTELARVDGATLAPLATTRHGIFAQVLGFVMNREDLAPRVLELVRPTRIDEVAVSGGITLDDTLVEGRGVRIFTAGKKSEAPAKLTLTGKLWSDPIRLDLAESASFSKATAAFVFGAGMEGELSPTEMRSVAMTARAVSPVTSYLAIEPGVRPSRIGLDGGGGTGWGSISCGRYGTIGHGSGTGWGYGGKDFEPQVDTAACVRKVKPTGPWAVKLAIETTNDEIVGVEIKNGSGPMADCLVEAAWTTRLDQRFDQAHDSFVVDLFSP